MKATQQKLKKKPEKFSKDACKHRCQLTLRDGEYESGASTGYTITPMLVWCKSCGAIGTETHSLSPRFDWKLPSRVK